MLIFYIFSFSLAVSTVYSVAESVFKNKAMKQPNMWDNVSSHVAVVILTHMPERQDDRIKGALCY